MVVILATAAVGLLVRTSWASGRTHAAEENAFAARIDADRAAHGLGDLTVNLQLTRVARGWAQQMAADSTLRHNPRLDQQVRGTWARLGENVGHSTQSGATARALVENLHTSFMRSPTHRANILGDFNQVGIGVAITGDTMWVAVVFSLDREVTADRHVTAAVRDSVQRFPAGSTDQRPDHVVVTSPTAGVGAARSLAGGDGPLLLTLPASAWDPSPVLHPLARAEIDRTLGGRGLVYVVGDRGDVSDRVVSELVADGYTVRRVSDA